MKARLLAGILLLFLTGSCRKNTDIGPADLLYQRWQLNQTKTVGTDNWVPFDPNGLYDTEYRADGRIIYRKDGAIQPAQCCAPVRFERNGNLIQYAEFPSCPFSLCVAIDNPVIRILREDLLELESNNVIAQYRAVK